MHPKTFSTALGSIYWLTPVRLSELLNLRLGDCDLAGNRLRIQAGKGDRDRVLPLTDFLLALLSA